MDAHQQMVNMLMQIYRTMTEEQRERFNDSAMSVIARLQDQQGFVNQGGQNSGGGVL